MASLRAEYTRRCLARSEAETTPEAPQAASLQAEYYPDSAANPRRGIYKDQRGLTARLDSFFCGGVWSSCPPSEPSGQMPDT